jgi:hypothetical protein
MEYKMLNWNSTREDTELISKIADRYITMCNGTSFRPPKKFNLLMDIEATNNNGCPLKLAELLKADDFDFAHDINGIINNINRQTGKLDNCFLPRYAK